MSISTREKRTRYRVKGSVDLLAHTLHWREFTWQAGPWQVLAEGAWGIIQVWAVSEAEGRRVINHALEIGGWSPAEQSEAVWRVREVVGKRAGRPGLCSVKLLVDGVAVLHRPSADGPPQYVPLLDELGSP